MPIELIWGVDVAIKKLRPNAIFQLEGTNFTMWEDPEGKGPPSWDEVVQQLEIDKKAAEEWSHTNEG